MLNQLTRQPRSQGALRSRPSKQEREREGGGEKEHARPGSLSRFEGRARSGPSERGC